MTFWNKLPTRMEWVDMQCHAYSKLLKMSKAFNDAHLFVNEKGC